MQDIAAPRRAGMKRLSLDILNSRHTGLLVALAVTLVALWLLTPNFMSYPNLLVIMRQVSILAILAIATTIIMIGGGLDLSIGASMVLCGLVSALVLREQGMAGLALAVVLGPALGLVIGVINGTLISRWKLNPLLVTLAASLSIRGFGYLSTGGRLAGGVPREVVDFMSQIRFGLPTAFIVALAVGLVAHVVISHTVLGATFKGLGSNEKAAEYLGLPVGRITIVLYAISGLLAGVASFVALSLGGSLSPNDYVGIELQAIAACVIGGARFKGGVGSIPGTLLGVLFIGVVLNGLVHLGLPSSYLKLSNGALLVFAVIVDSLRRRRNLAG